MNLTKIANRLIPPPKHTKTLRYADGVTRDIIKEVLDTYKQSIGMLDAFAPYLKGSTVEQTCKNIYSFWKSNIRYKVDPDGVQWAKTPAAVWHSKFCDCKSFSIAIATCLQALGIAFKIRFASYGSNTTVPTHVYVVALHQGKQIIIDCVWHRFNSQKQFTKNWDYMSTKIYRIAGFEDTILQQDSYAVGELNVDIDDTTSQAELDLALSKQGLELEQHLIRRKGIAGANSATDNAYQIEIEAHNAAIAAIGTPKDKKKKPTRAAAPKASSKPKAVEKPKAATKPLTATEVKKVEKATATIKKRKTGLLKKVGAGVKKVVGAPVLAALKNQLPANSPFFLYLFLNPLDNKLFAALPAAVKLKRDKAIKYKKLIVTKLGMKEQNFNTAIRNGIISKLGKTPEAVLADWMREANFKVGILPVMLAAGKGLKMLLGKAGENLKADIEQFAPTPEDWQAGDMPKALKEAAAEDVESNSNNNDVTKGGQRVIPTTNDGTSYVVKESKSVTTPTTNTAPDADNDEKPINETKSQTGNEQSTATEFVDSKTNELAPTLTPQADRGDNSKMIAAVAIVGVGLLMFAGKGKKVK